MITITPIILIGSVSAAIGFSSAVGTFIGYRSRRRQTAAAELVALHAAISSKLGIAEHTVICESQNREIQQKLDLIVGMIEAATLERQRLADFVSKKEEVAQESREKVNANLQEITVALAVLGATTNLRNTAAVVAEQRPAANLVISQTATP
jgi:cytochrome c biogenesis factor